MGQYRISRNEYCEIREESFVRWRQKPNPNENRIRILVLTRKKGRGRNTLLLEGRRLEGKS